MNFLYFILVYIVLDIIFVFRIETIKTRYGQAVALYHFPYGKLNFIIKFSLKFFFFLFLSIHIFSLSQGLMQLGNFSNYKPIKINDLNYILSSFCLFIYLFFNYKWLKKILSCQEVYSFKHMYSIKKEDLGQFIIFKNILSCNISHILKYLKIIGKIFSTMFLAKINLFLFLSHKTHMIYFLLFHS